MYKRKTCMFTRATTYDIINRTYHGGAILFFYTFILFFTFFFFYLLLSLFLSSSLSISLSISFIIIINEVIYFKETRRILRNTFDWTISSNIYDVEKVANWMDGCCCTRDEKRNFFSTWSRNW